MNRIVSLALAAVGALAAFGCGPSAPEHFLLLDIQIQQTGGPQGIRHATVLLDGKEVAHFEQEQPESSVVFSKMVDGVPPGPHLIQVRIDDQVTSPTTYVSSGVAHYDGKPHPLDEVGGEIATGKAFRFQVQL